MSDLPRLMHHFEPKKGWINDPNGLCFFGGKYHAFFQHYPFEAKWGPMHWGHAVSEDLVNWEELPIALYPDMPYENGGGCFSGSALEKDGVLYLMYTSVSKEHGQTQSIAVSRDGLHFEKLPENPVIPQSPLDPENHDFRDPKIFPYGDGYRMVCGAGQGGVGYVLLFRSPDLLHWEYAGKLFESDQFGAVPECPDFFPLGDKWVLLFSRMDTRSAQFIVGEFDGVHFTPESYQQPECGTDFYAPQTFLDGKGRRLMIGWLYNWDRKAPSAERPYRTDAAGRKGFSLPCRGNSEPAARRRRASSPAGRCAEGDKRRAHPAGASPFPDIGCSGTAGYQNL